MRENKIIIVINKPVSEVFEFTTNPKNTSIWIKHIIKEVANEYPPKIGTIYRNTNDTRKWDSYEVVAFEKDELFTLKSLDEKYFVRYSYKRISDKKTELQYFEWVVEGELENPFTQGILQGLKKIMEEDMW